MKCHMYSEIPELISILHSEALKSGIPLRCMDICGAGGFLLSNYQADLYDVFVP